MGFVHANPKWLLIVFFYALIDNSLHCTFKSVTSSFKASSKVTFKGITENEYMSKCSADMECIFLDYNQSTCRTFTQGNEVQKRDSASKVFAYSFDENESSCPIKVVSKPKLRTIKTKICNNDDYLYARFSEDNVALTKTNLTKAPDNVRECSIPQYLASNRVGCNVTVLKRYLSGKCYRYTISKDSGYGSVCADYCEKAPYAVAEYKCKGQNRYVTVIDDKGGPNPEFPDFGDLEWFKATPIFYVDDG